MAHQDAQEGASIHGSSRGRPGLMATTYADDMYLQLACANEAAGKLGSSSLVKSYVEWESLSRLIVSPTTPGRKLIQGK